MFLWDNQASKYCGNIISLYKYDQSCIKKYTVYVYIYIIYIYAHQILYTSQDLYSHYIHDTQWIYLLQ